LFCPAEVERFLKLLRYHHQIPNLVRACTDKKKRAEMDRMHVVIPGMFSHLAEVVSDS
jgi:hypothetical protein